MQSALVLTPVGARPSFSVAQLPKAGRASRTALVTRAAAITADEVPDMGKRVSTASSPDVSQIGWLAASR